MPKKDEDKEVKEGEGVEEEKTAKTGKGKKGDIDKERLQAILKNFAVEILNPMASTGSWKEHINSEIDKL